MERRIFIQSMILSSGYVLLDVNRLKRFNFNKDAVRLVMIYNNMGNASSLKDAWGLSIWIEKENSAILFDTGGDASILWQNILDTDIDIRKIKKIVISHNHWDHKNGLRLILEKTFYQPDVYIPEHDLAEYRIEYPEAKLTGISQARQIEDGTWSTGQLKGSIRGYEIYEQSLILVQDNSFYLLTGCSHPGIVNIVRAATEIFPDKDIALVAGGFHLIDKSEKEIRDI
jgi:7,8-dihydropterin-6-yl-methyl-4-(beta-D-ribofuranosyl)aminobenzene 5'-phosphate synthase